MAEVKNQAGLAVKTEKYAVVKKEGLAGSIIEKHNHPEAFILFTVVKGNIEVTLNDNEVYNLLPGQILHFDGDNYISAKLLQDSEAFVTLINK